MALSDSGTSIMLPICAFRSQEWSIMWIIGFLSLVGTNAGAFTKGRRYSTFVSQWSDGADSITYRLLWNTARSTKKGSQVLPSSPISKWLPFWVCSCTTLAGSTLASSWRDTRVSTELVDLMLSEFPSRQTQKWKRIQYLSGVLMNFEEICQRQRWL